MAQDSHAHMSWPCAWSSKLNRALLHAGGQRVPRSMRRATTNASIFPISACVTSATVPLAKVSFTVNGLKGWRNWLHLLLEVVAKAHCKPGCMQDGKSLWPFLQSVIASGAKANCKWITMVFFWQKPSPPCHHKPHSTPPAESFPPRPLVLCSSLAPVASPACGYLM